MKTGRIKILEVFIEERMHLAYCGHIVYKYHNEKQFTPVTDKVEVTECEDFEYCLRFLKKKMRELVSERRAKDYAKQRRIAGWL